MELTEGLPIEAKAAGRVDPDSIRWQHNLLPFMRRVVSALALFFFTASCIQLIYLNQKILDPPVIDAEKIVSLPPAGSQQTFQQTLDGIRLKALVALEATATSSQYRQAGILLAARLWTTYLGFITGMILAFVGATFVLGKLEEETSELKAEANNLKVSFNSASPGLILAVLGVILMVCTILTHNDIDVTHRATYLFDTPSASTASSASPETTDKPPALDIPSQKK